MIKRRFIRQFRAVGFAPACMLLLLAASLVNAQPPEAQDSASAIKVDGNKADADDNKADDNKADVNDKAIPDSQDSRGETDEPEGENAAREEVDKALNSLAALIQAAPASRATIALSARTSIGQEAISVDKAIYQISSRSPNCFAAYFKSADQSFRIYCNGDFTGVQIGEDAYFKTTATDSLQAVVTDLPVPLGPYPEPVMALCLAGVDMKNSFMTDMRSIEVVDREPFNQTPAIHLRGVQADEVTWDLWLSTEKDKVQPLRMVIDLTQVLSTGDDSELPEGFRYEIEFLFTLWRMSGNYDAKQFTYTPPAKALEYESLDAYYESLSGVPESHPLVGMPSPDFEAELLPVADDKPEGDGQEADKAQAPPASKTQVKLSDLRGKVVVLDFWATWCGPCIEAMPVIDRVTKKYAEKGVEFYALNIGESEQDVQAFFETAKVRPKVLLDPQSVHADAYKAEAIPQTVLIGKDGRVEMVHVGYESLESLEQQLDRQLNVLANGGSLLSDSQAK